MKIPLTNGGFTLVSQIDYKYLKQWCWYAKYSRGIWYACITRYIKNKRPFIHILIAQRMGLQSGSIDHINGDSLDNRRSNLRSATQQQNGANSKLRKNNKSGYKGVYWKKSLHKWAAKLAKHHLGYFSTASQAAKVYNKAAKIKYGKYAKLNKV